MEMQIAVVIVPEQHQMDSLINQKLVTVSRSRSPYFKKNIVHFLGGKHPPPWDCFAGYRPAVTFREAKLSLEKEGIFLSVFDCSASGIAESFSGAEQRFLPLFLK
jgi:hypothetical protein